MKKPRAIPLVQCLFLAEWEVAGRVLAGDVLNLPIKIVKKKDKHAVK